MKRVVLIVMGVVLLIVSVPFLIGGVAFTAIGSGDDPTVGGRLGQVDSGGYAVVSDTLEVHVDYPLADRFDITVGARNARSDAPVFIGYGPASAVDSYLSGVPQTLVSGLGGGNRSEREVDIPGDAVPGAPAEQDFWLARASGTGLQKIPLPLASQPGDYRLVVMNADTSRGLVLDVYGYVTLPFLVPLGLSMLVLGLVLLVLGVALLVWGIRSRPAPAKAPPPYGYPPPAPPYHPGSGTHGPPGPYPGVAPDGPAPDGPAPGGPAPGFAPGGPAPGFAPGGPAPGGPPAPAPPPAVSGATGPEGPRPPTPD